MHKWLPHGCWCVLRTGSRVDRLRRTPVRAAVWLSRGWMGAWDPANLVWLVLGAGERVAEVWSVWRTGSGESDAAGRCVRYV
jgi:hypothetical protein